MARASDMNRSTPSKSARPSTGDGAHRREGRREGDEAASGDGRRDEVEDEVDGVEGMGRRGEGFETLGEADAPQIAHARDAEHHRHRGA